MGLYGSAFNELTPQEQELWEFARKTLDDGQRLYGTSEEDTEHLGWVLGLIVHRMKQADNPTACYLEIVHDESGYGVAFILPEPAQVPTSQDSS